MTIVIKDGTVIITDDNFQDYRTTYNTNFPYYNNICMSCPNNPRNGGSGICNCILGTQIVY